MVAFIGIDLGTSSVKLVLTDEKGQVLREAGQDYRLLQPAPGWKEIDPETWWNATADVLEVLLDGVSR
ncbi:MAG: xylulokinase, partial [Clostridiales bacterium]|nr:xylulokinase [Clostridiales bacterium]